MKNILKYISALVLLLVIGTSCKDNDNWVIIEDVQPGNYITGDATIYNAPAVSSQFVVAAVDADEKPTDVMSIYTWLKASGSFQILKSDADGNQVSYGKGSLVSSTPFETFALAEGGTPFTVAKDGLYFVVLNNADNQVSIIDAAYGIIGDATPGAWNDETKFTDVSYDEKFSTVNLALSGVYLNNKGMKFRFSGDWGILVPYKEGTIKIHSNAGATAEGPIGKAFVNCEEGGANFSVATAGTYDVAMRFELRTGKISAKAICTGEDTSTAKLPENMYVVGSINDWNWANAFELIPVHSNDGHFWGIYYLPEGAQFKFNSSKAWDGNDFGSASKDPVGIGEIEIGGENITIEKAGFYMLRVTSALTADKRNIITKAFISEAAPYVIGDCAAEGWGAQLADADKFQLDNGAFKHTLAKSGELRLCVNIPEYSWWQTEFIILDNVIEFRGAGADQTRVQATAGQVVTLDFANGTGSIQ